MITRRSPGDESSRAPSKAASDGLTATVPRGADVPAQFNRRKRASYRLEPLDDGYRDPWDRAEPIGEPVDWSQSAVFLGDGRLVGLCDLVDVA